MAEGRTEVREGLPVLNVPSSGLTPALLVHALALSCAQKRNGQGGFGSYQGGNVQYASI
jgi:hypothetical protein